MINYTTDKNNHYIQAAWTGTFWGIPNKKKESTILESLFF